MVSDASEGDGWWLASDGKWYAPDKHGDPQYRAQYAAPPVDAPPPVPPPAPIDPLAAAVEPPPAIAPPPPAPPPAPIAPATPAAATAGPTQGVGLMANPATWIVGIGALVGLAAVLILFVFSDSDDENEPTAALDLPGVEDPVLDDDPATSSSDDTTSGSATQTTDDQDGPTVVMPSGVGTADEPIAFGQTYVWDEWAGSVVEIIDVVDAGLVDEFSDSPADGNMFIGVIYEATYLGPEFTGIEPFLLESPNTSAVDGFACFLDSALLHDIGIEFNEFELIRGQSSLQIECLEVPIGNLDDISMSLNNVSQFGDAIAFALEGATLPALPPFPGPGDYATSPLGTVLDSDDWTAAVTEVLNGADAGLISDFSTPPRDSYIYVVVRYEVTYSGTAQDEFLPHLVSGLGSAVFSSFNSCFLDEDAATAMGLDVNVFSFSANQSASLGACLEVPVAEESSFVVRLENPFVFDGPEPILYAAS